MQVERGQLSLPPEEAMASMYRSARTLLLQHGFRQYEVSNFARRVSRARRRR